MKSVCLAAPGSSSTWSVYHAYPLDASRFLQCDPAGHVFVLRCGADKVWNDAYKTCVGGGGTTSSQGQGLSRAIMYYVFIVKVKVRVNGIAVSNSN